MPVQELGHLGAVRGALMDARFHAFAGLLVELLVVFLLLRDLRRHLQTFLHQILNHAQDLVLLQSLARDFQRHVLIVDDVFDHIQPLRPQLVVVVHDEDTTHVQLDDIALLLQFEEVEDSTTRNEEQGTEIQPTLHGEVLHGKMIFLDALADDVEDVLL
eukprot:1092562-Heterocapsa_arctica.AAC.1